VSSRIVTTGCLASNSTQGDPYSHFYTSGYKWLPSAVESNCCLSAVAYSNTTDHAGVLRKLLVSYPCCAGSSSWYSISPYCEASSPFASWLCSVACTGCLRVPVAIRCTQGGVSWTLDPLCHNCLHLCSTLVPTAHFDLAVRAAIQMSRNAAGKCLGSVHGYFAFSS